MSWWDDFWDWLFGDDPGDPDPPDDPWDPDEDYDPDWDDEPYDDPDDCYEWVWDELPLADINTGEDVPGTGSGHWENICFA